jgi:hypothetical protein
MFKAFSAKPRCTNFLWENNATRDGVSSASQYQSIPVNTSHYQSLPVNTSQYQAIPVTTSQYQSIPVHTSQYQSIPVTTSHYQSIPRCNRKRDRGLHVITDADRFRGGSVSVRSVYRPTFKFSSSGTSPIPLAIYNCSQRQIIKTPLDKNTLDEGVCYANQDLTLSLHEGVTVLIST